MGRERVARIDARAWALQPTTDKLPLQKLVHLWVTFSSCLIISKTIKQMR